MNDGITVSDPEPVVRTRSVISSSYQQCGQETRGVLRSQLFHLLSGGRIVLVLSTLVYTLCPEGLLCTLCPPGELLLLFQGSQLKLLLLREAPLIFPW